MLMVIRHVQCNIIWTASSEFGTYHLCEQWRFRRACASAQSRQNLRCSLIQAVSQEEPSDRKPDPWPLCMAGHAQLKFVMTECSKTQIRLTGLISLWTMLIVFHHPACPAQRPVFQGPTGCAVLSKYFLPKWLSVRELAELLCVKFIHSIVCTGTCICL